MRAACVLLLLASCLAWAAEAQTHREVRRAQECASFTPTLCVVPDVHVEKRHCHPYPCSFDVDREFFCPLVAGGYYSYSTGGEGGGCPDPFMAQAHHLPPPCGARCCRTDHAGAFAQEDESDGEGDGEGGSNAAPEGADADAAADGREDYDGGGGDIAPDFHPAGGGSSRAARAARGPPRASFQPSDSTCRYREIGRGQLMRFLATHNSSLLVVGDSTMRQLFLRLVALMRGQRRQLDLHLHTHLHYQFCREVDFLRVAANNAGGDSAAVDPRFLRGVVPAFFQMGVGPGQADAKRLLAECSRPALQANYMQAPLWASQTYLLPRYLKALPAGHRPVVVASVGYWQGGQGVPEAYLEALEALRGSVTRVFLLGVPVARVGDPDARRRLAARNAALRSWAAAAGAPFAYVDFDALAAAEGAPRGTLGSKHYACWVDWRSARFPVGAAGNPAGGGQVLGRVERLHATQDGACSDEMDRNLWQLMLNALLDSSGAGKMEEGAPGP